LVVSSSLIVVAELDGKVQQIVGFREPGYRDGSLAVSRFSAP